MLTFAIVGVGLLFAPSGARAGIFAGGVIALGLQLSLFAAALFMAPRPLVVYGVGLAARIAALLVVGLIVVPTAELPAAATLLSLVAVFFVTTLLQPALEGTASGLRS